MGSKGSSSFLGDYEYNYTTPLALMKEVKEEEEERDYTENYLVYQACLVEKAKK
jgi:hypothetical protein